MRWEASGWGETTWDHKQRDEERWTVMKGGGEKSWDDVN